MLLTFSSQTETAAMENLKTRISAMLKSFDGTTAVAFIDPVNPGSSFSLNGDLVFHAASTMKTAVMIGVLKMVEEKKINLSDTVLVKNKFRSIVDSSEYSLDISEDSGDRLYSLQGKYVTVESLLEDMITVSGNLATNILIELTGSKYIGRILKEHSVNGINVLRGVEDIKAFEAGMNNTVTAEGLASLFYKLQKNEFCSRVLTEQMISILLRQKFQSMIPKYLPENVKVAHKTGSITAIMHDSGIIYLPDGRWYVLVILNKDFKNPEDARERSAKISEEIYRFFTGN